MDILQTALHHSLNTHALVRAFEGNAFDQGELVWINVDDLSVSDRYELALVGFQ